MSKKTKFSAEDEEKIINFVKYNNILYNKKHKRFRDTEAKNRLWLQLASELTMDVEVVKKKWQTMRDYFVRTEATGSAAAKSSKRHASLSFLLQTTILNRSQSIDDADDLSCFDGSISQTPMPKKRCVSHFMTEKPSDDIQEFFDSMASTVRKFSPVTTAQIKLKIAQIVVGKEITWAKKEAVVENYSRN